MSLYKQSFRSTLSFYELQDLKIIIHFVHCDKYLFRGDVR